jgi:hypothetical protein
VNAHALGGQRLERRGVDRALGQPHALGRAAEAVAEVGQPPAHLGAAIARRAQRHDQVAVGLGQRRAVAERGAGWRVGGDQAAWTSGAWRASHVSNVGPTLKLMRA